MITNELERAQPDREVYIARNARILKAMQMATAGLVGTVVEVIPAGDAEFSPAIEAAEKSGERLYPPSGEKYLQPGSRYVTALVSIREDAGGVVSVEFDDQKDRGVQRDNFLTRTAEYLLHQSENFIEGNPPDTSRKETEIDLKRFYRISLLKVQRAQERFARHDDTRSMEDAVNDLSAAIAQFELARDALEAGEEIAIVNDASLGKHR